jgi:hypothetical protein
MTIRSCASRRGLLARVTGRGNGCASEQTVNPKPYTLTGRSNGPGCVV